MYKLYTICKKDKKTKEFYKGRQQCIPCYLAKKKTHTATTKEDLVGMQGKLEHVAGRAYRSRVRHRNKIVALKTRVGALESKLDDTTAALDEVQLENTQLNIKLELMGYRMDEMQETLSDAVSACVTLGEGYKTTEGCFHKISRLFSIVFERHGGVATSKVWKYIRGTAERDINLRMDDKVYDTETMEWVEPT
ncbi:hypothetical protein BKA57DRAFT_510420 [Linnemannia elongata]|nr:hypothetical protein BKA57DRAFT_510420 [Linnemannia elongata]